MDTQNQVRLNRVVLDVMSIQHLVETDKIDDDDALRKFSKAFDTLVDIRDQCPDDDIQGYVEAVWDHIAKLSLNS
jgi:hypothetical protein